jgi:hypothetical protein
MRALIFSSSMLMLFSDELCGIVKADRPFSPFGQSESDDPDYVSDDFYYEDASGGHKREGYSRYHDYYERFEHDKTTVDDYMIYDLIDRMTTMTEYSTFYGLLQVDALADTLAISTAYRKLSKKWHPDRNSKDQNAHEKFALLSGISTILKNPKSRKRYDWIVNEAPIWHKSGYYVHRYMTAKLNILQVIVIITGIFTFMQIFKELGRWAFARYRQWDASCRLKRMGKGEYKRLETKMSKLSQITDLQILQSSDIEDWILVHNNLEPLNLVDHVLLFNGLYFCYSHTFGRIFSLFRLKHYPNSRSD